MPPDHVTTVISTQRWDAEETAYVYQYRALCSGCRWKGRRYPLNHRRLAEHQAEFHQNYHRNVARLTTGADR